MEGVGGPLGEDVGLARADTGDYQHRAVQRLNDRPLFTGKPIGIVHRIRHPL